MPIMLLYTADRRACRGSARPSSDALYMVHLRELIITNENLGPKEDAGLNQSLILRVRKR